MMPKILGWKVSSVLVAIQRPALVKQTKIRERNAASFLYGNGFFSSPHTQPVHYRNDSSGDGLTSWTLLGTGVREKLP
jgi:hypothetical protein